MAVVAPAHLKEAVAAASLAQRFSGGWDHVLLFLTHSQCKLMPSKTQGWRVKPSSMFLYSFQHIIHVWICLNECKLSMKKWKTSQKVTFLLWKRGIKNNGRSKGNWHKLSSNKTFLMVGNKSPVNHCHWTGWSLDPSETQRSRATQTQEPTGQRRQGPGTDPSPPASSALQRKHTVTQVTDTPVSTGKTIYDTNQLL